MDGQGRLRAHPGLWQRLHLHRVRDAGVHVARNPQRVLGHNGGLVPPRGALLRGSTPRRGRRVRRGSTAAKGQQMPGSARPPHRCGAAGLAVDENAALLGPAHGSDGGEEGVGADLDGDPAPPHVPDQVGVHGQAEGVPGFCGGHEAEGHGQAPQDLGERVQVAEHCVHVVQAGSDRSVALPRLLGAKAAVVLLRPRVAAGVGHGQRVGGRQPHGRGQARIMHRLTGRGRPGSGHGCRHRRRCRAP